jgi:argininosuccinate synthase
MKESVAKTVLAYSGGLDTSVIVPWLKERYGCEVVTFTADVGQGEQELAGLEEKAIASGASKAYVIDLREEFLREYAFPTMQAGAISRSPNRRGRTPWPTAAPARATTRSVLS